MTPHEFIITRLNQLVERFPQLVFKYVYDERENCHIIEAEPFADFKNSIEYLEAEADLVFDFENNCLPDSILFVSEESLNRVIDPDIIISTKNIGLYVENLVYTPNFEFKTSLQAGENILNYAIAA